MASHLTRLRKENLVTDRDSIIMKSADGTIIEVFEWLSKEAMAEAHTNAEVQKMWQEYSEVCEYVPISTVQESTNLFSEFEPVN